MRAGRRAGGAATAIGWSAVVAAIAGVIACGFALERPASAEGALAGAPPAPPRLTDTGLYLADGTVDPRNRPFSPQYPLWTDGAGKSRWIRLPDGAAIDVSDVDAWRFPPGTIVWKEFAWGGRKVETRMIRAEANGAWTFATYVWNEEQSDALLASEDGVRAAYEIAPGKRHSIPGVADCMTCHGSGPSVLLGFGALQLSDDRDPLAPHAEAPPVGAVTLRTLVAEGRLSPPRPGLALDPPRIRERDPVARAAIGYLSANCGGCHNTRGPLARLGFTLRHDAGGAPDAPEPATTAIGAHGRFVVPGVAPDSSYLVAPGAPDRSAVLARMRSRRASSQMPPLGTVMTDDVAVDLVRRWIAGLGLPIHQRSALERPRGAGE